MGKKSFCSAKIVPNYHVTKVKFFPSTIHIALTMIVIMTKFSDEQQLRRLLASAFRKIYKPFTAFNDYFHVRHAIAKIIKANTEFVFVTKMQFWKIIFMGSTIETFFGIVSVKLEGIV